MKFMFIFFNISTCKTRYLLRDVMYTFGDQMEVSVPSDQSTSAIRLKGNIVNWAIKTLINVANENGGGDARDAEIRRQVNNLHTHYPSFLYLERLLPSNALSLSRSLALSLLLECVTDIYHLLLFFLFGNYQKGIVSSSCHESLLDLLCIRRPVLQKQKDSKGSYSEGVRGVTLNLLPWVSEVGKKCCEVLGWTSGAPLSWRCANDSEVARNGIDCLSILASDGDVRLRLIEVCDRHVYVSFISIICC